MDEILKYFPDLTAIQRAIRKVRLLYHDWNEKINVISRKDIDALYTKHILHSLGIAKVIDFVPGTYVLDVGTGGVSGIPLVLFPETRFYLIDIIAKKLK
jgi:16S rRNA (guanine527-N7)-methyltransferase